MRWVASRDDENPGAPASAGSLASALRTLVDAYRQLAIDYPAEVPELDAQASLRAVAAANAKVFEICQ